MQLIAGVAILDIVGRADIAGWRAIPVPWLAPRMGLLPTYVQYIKVGKRGLSAEEGARLVAAVAAWNSEQGRQPRRTRRTRKTRKTHINTTTNQ